MQLGLEQETRTVLMIVLGWNQKIDVAILPWLNMTLTLMR